MLAASTSPGAAQALLEAGASPSERALGRSALDVAAACDQDRLVARLLEHEAIGESDLESALRESAGAGSESVLSRLLSRHFGPFAGAALHRALRSAVKAQQLVATRRLLDAGAILDDPTSARPSPLIEAVRVGSSELIRMLLDAGANLEATLPNPEDYDPQERLATGSTPLIEAARAGDAEVAKVLLENGASVNAFDEGGVSALMAAMAVGAWDVASVLLDHGAGRAGAEPFEIAGAIACDDTERLRGILKKAAGAANSVVRDAFGRSWTPMSFAAAQRSLASAVFLLEVGSDPDSRIPTEPKHSRRVRAIVREGGVSGFLAMQREVGVPRYWTPLMISAWLGDREMVEVLLGANAQQLPIGPEHLTPLHLACAGDHPEVAEMLIRAGAELGCEACDGSTPLDLVPEGSRRVFAPSVGHSGAGHRRR